MIERLVPSLRSWPRRPHPTGVSWANPRQPNTDVCPGRALERDGHDQDPTPVRHDSAFEAAERLFLLHSRD